MASMPVRRVQRPRVPVQGSPLKVDVGDRVRFFVVNAGPSFNSDFHVVGAIFDRVYPDGDPKHVLTGADLPVPAGGGAVFETVFARMGAAKASIRS